MLKRTLKQWLPLAVAILGLGGLIYLVEQQALRLGANEPQIALARDAAQALAGGAAPAAVLPDAQVDIAASLSPFVTVFDAAGRALATSGRLADQPPALPAGVLGYVRQHGEDRVTWQPEPGVRVAAVVLRSSGPQPGFVLAGRSLREVEARVDQLGQLVALALAVTLAATLVMTGVMALL